MNALTQLRIKAHRRLIRWGIDIRRLRPDRAMLENVIFPEIMATPNYQRILFVGCAWYTLHYPSLFTDREFHTMEICPDEAKYGARRHIVDSCENIEEYFGEASLDVVIFNGVYGCGLDEIGSINTSLNAMHRALRRNGLFVFGWNDLPQHARYPLAEIEGLRKFEPYVFPVLNSSIHESNCHNRHRFHFYVKPN